MFVITFLSLLCNLKLVVMHYFLLKFLSFIIVDGIVIEPNRTSVRDNNGPDYCLVAHIIYLFNCSKSML